MRFSDPDEFAMGATYWKTQLRQRRRVVRDLPDAMGVGGVFVPFSFDSRFVAFQTVTFGSWPPKLSLSIFGVADDHRAMRSLESFISSVQWSPTVPLLLAQTNEKLTIVDEGTELVGLVPLASQDEGEPSLDEAIVGWTPSGSEVFVVAPDERGSTSIAFYDTSGNFVGREPLDPDDVVPYDREAYASLRRDYWSLNVGPGTSSVASLLDHWSASRYDPVSGELKLAILRPTSPPRHEPTPWGTELVADAEARWIAVRINGGPCAA